MKILELFSGTESFSKVARVRGHECFTVDKDKRFKPSLCKNIFRLETNEIIDKFGYPDIIWASPPCPRFSIATHRHWENHEPRPDTLRDIDLIHHTLELIFRLHPKFWILENPKGRLRWILGKPPNTTYYGSYGHPIAKETDLWGYYPDIKFKGKPKEKMGVFAEDLARSSKARSVIPRNLCLEIIKACEKGVKGWV